MLLLCFCPCITLPLLLLPLPKKPVSAMMGEREEDAREEEAELCTPMNSSDHWDRWARVMKATKIQGDISSWKWVGSILT